MKGVTMAISNPLVPARPESRGSAQVRFIARADCDACVVCRYDGGPVRLVDFKMPQYPPVSDNEVAVLDEIDPLVLCETCIATAAQVLGLFRDPATDPDVVKLNAALGAARAREEKAYVEASGLEDRVRELTREISQ
jgi:hypothetical protein